jgi:integrase family protein with SAM-like domain
MCKSIAIYGKLAKLLHQGMSPTFCSLPDLRSFSVRLTSIYEPSLESAFWSNYTLSGFPPTKTLPKSFAKYLEECGEYCLRRCLPVLLVQAIDEFFNGYFSTHERSAKTRIAYRSDLDQMAAHAGKHFALISLNASFIEKWAADLRRRNYSPASMRRKMVVLKVFCS